MREECEDGMCSEPLEPFDPARAAAGALWGCLIVAALVGGGLWAALRLAGFLGALGGS